MSRCGNTIHSDYVTDHQCQRARGHAGSCCFGCQSYEDGVRQGQRFEQARIRVAIEERLEAIDADLRAEGLGLHDELGLAALDAEMRAQRIAMRDQVEADVLGGIRIHLPEGLTADQQSAWYTAFAQPKTQCADCGGEPDHLYCWRWAERLHCWLLRFRWYS